MDRTELITSVSSLGYSDTTAITAALQRTYKRVLGMRRWDFLEAQDTASIAAGDTTITLPTDLKRVDAIELARSDGTSVDFQFRPYQQFRDYAKWQTDQGEPQWWTQRGGVVYIWPEAQTSYTATIDYVKHPADYLDAADDVPVFPEEYHDVLVYGAAVDLAARQRDEIAFNHLSNLYTTRLTEMVAEHGVTQRQNATHVRRSNFWNSIRSFG